ncbi:hypothetical protein IX51_07990 [uncultured archaeon]|nr:hypothetical protein IX51_07990 [uncultured archaeon]
MSKQSGETPSILRDRTNETKRNDFTNDKESLSLESMSYCSRFEICSAPKCPLDILIDIRTSIEDDPKCEMAKPTRHKYWLSMPDELKSRLPYRGYLSKEYNRKLAARKRWDSLTDEQRKEIRDRLSKGGQYDEA